MDGTSATALAPGIASRFWVISLGKKVLMAVSGVVMVGFVTGHMIGNLQLFIGQAQLNRYAEFLKSLGPILYLIRAFLLIWLVLHVWTGVRLWFENKRARPIQYNRKGRVQSTISSRWMIWTGLAIFSFLIYHLLHYTFIVTNPIYKDLTWQGHADTYSMVIMGFQNYLISAVYIVGMAFLALHLRHAVNSMFQTMGWNTGTVQPVLDKLALVFAWLVFVGYIAMPIGVMLGAVKLPGGGY